MNDCDCPDVKCAEGIPAWVMTFADLMSLLLAFFVLLFSFSEMDKNVYKELAGSMKDAFGVQREIVAKETPRGINIIAREFSPGRPAPTPINEVRQMTTDENKRHPVINASSDKDGAEDRAAREELLDEELARRLSRLNEELLQKMTADVEAIREELEEEINDGLIDIDVKDKRIILRIREKGAFPSGSATIIQPFNAITGKISKVFSEFDGMMIVSGHTDNLPISTDRFRSNWELSASRAVSVIHALRRDSRLTDKNFEIAAYADTRPVDTNDTYLGRAKNRRVEIMLDYADDPGAIPVFNQDSGEYELRSLPDTGEAGGAGEAGAAGEATYLEDVAEQFGR